MEKEVCQPWFLHKKDDAILFPIQRVPHTYKNKIFLILAK